MIWHRSFTVEEMNEMCKDTLLTATGIEITEIGEDYVRGTMPVDSRTVQPFRILHGGASVALAESLGSIGSVMVVDQSQYIAVGLEINANHIRPVRNGKVIGTAKPIHLGRKTHIWDIQITTEEGKMVCVSRLTMAVMPKAKTVKEGQ